MRFLDGVMRTRFHAEPMVQATELLLQERTPRDVAITRPWAAEVKSAASARDIEPPGGRRFATAHQSAVATHLLSNGRYRHHADGGWLRLQPLGRFCRDPLARGRDLR